MISKNYFFVFFATLLVAGFIFMALPNTAKSGVAIPMGCCLKTGNAQNPQCPQCGGNGDFCMSPNQDCTFGFSPDEFCLREPGPDVCETNVCCFIAVGDCEQLPESLCADVDEEGVGDCGQFQRCVGPPPKLCCDETQSGNLCQDDLTAEECATAGGMPNAGLTCTATDGECNGGDPPDNIPGCCQFGNGTDSCNNDPSLDCANGGGTPVNGGECFEGSDFCDFNPEGCCVLGPADCIITTAGNCKGDYQGNGSTCDIIICNFVASPIPTLNQWGLIAMAGLLGLFSLFIIIRRRRYNVG